MLLTLLILIPIVAGIAVLFLREEQTRLIQRVSLGAGLATAGLGTIVTILFLSQPFWIQEKMPDMAQAGQPPADRSAMNQISDKKRSLAQNPLLHQEIGWFAPSTATPHPKTGQPVLPRYFLGFSYHVGVDGLSIWLVALSAFLTPIVVASSFSSITQNVRLYYSLLLILQGAVIGVFCARDLLLFYIFFEFSLVPLYLLVGNYGHEQRRRAANLLFLYTFAGSMLTFAGILYLAFAATRWADSGVFTFDIDTLQKMVLSGHLSNTELWWLFAAMFVGFAIKVPLFPFHTWLALAHTEAPTAGSVLLAGVLLKLGTYGFLRFCLPMLPNAAYDWAPFIAVISIVGILYPAWVAWVQRDIKRLVAYSSVSHLGLCMLGMFSLTPAGITGSVMYMVNHGLSTGALFLLVGMFYERFHTRQFSELGGLAKVMPVFAFFLLFFSLTSIALPGTNGFISEFLVIFGTFISNSMQFGTGQPTFAGPLGPWYAIPAALAVIFGAIYILDMVRKLAFGPLKYPGYVPPAETDGHGHGHGHDHGGHGDAANHGHAAHDGPPAPGTGMGLDAHGGHGHGPAWTGKLDLNTREIAILAPMALACLIIGVYPQALVRSIEPEARFTVKLIAEDFNHRRPLYASPATPPPAAQPSQQAARAADPTPLEPDMTAAPVSVPVANASTGKELTHE